MYFQDVMAQLRAELQLPPLNFDELGGCALRFDSVAVNFSPVGSGDSLLLRSRLGFVGFNDAQALEFLLADNLFPWASGASVLGIDTEGAVFLTQRLSLDSHSHPEMMNQLGRFLSRARSWRARLPQRQSSPSDPSDGSTP
ncbi:MAG: type III secretion system chaperone [Gammaproteobacteria bacterium]